MLGFFPTPYPDELLYSILARYHIRSGNTSPKWTMFELFGTRNLRAVVDLPGNIEQLINRMPENAKFTADELIYYHTLLPYYLPFIPPDRASSVLYSMKYEKANNIHMKLGIMASSIAYPKYLKYCPVCKKENESKYGEPYWHRSHQIPGVLICPDHEVPILNSNIPTDGLTNVHEFISAGSILNDENPSNYSDKNLASLLTLAEDTRLLLKTEIESKQGQYYYENYLSLLIAKGYASAKGRVDQKQLLDDFVDYYGQEFLELVESMVHYEEMNNWLSTITRKHRKVFHPLRHLLFMRFLSAGSPQKIFKSQYSYKPFGDSPWPCLNSASDHYKKFVVRDLKITHCSDTKKPVGTFSCDCGFVYSRRGPDKDEFDKYRRGRVKAFGPVWLKKLQQLIKDERLSIREIARRLGVDSKTVKRYACGDSKTSKVDSSEEQDVKDQKRAEWLKLQQEYVNYSKTSLREIDPGLFVWLYRHDREWLDKNSPVCNTKKPVTNRVDWHSRDLEILDKVKETVKETLESKNKPERITVSNIGRKIGYLSLLEKQLDKMPLTKEYLSSVNESTDDFQIKRVKWVAELLQKKGEKIREWKIIKIAGIGSNITRVVFDTIEKLLKEKQY